MKTQPFLYKQIGWVWERITGGMRCRLIASLVLSLQVAGTDAFAIPEPDGCHCFYISPGGDRGPGLPEANSVSHCLTPIAFYGCDTREINIRLRMFFDGGGSDGCQDDAPWASNEASYHFEFYAEDGRWRLGSNFRDGPYIVCDLRWEKSGRRDDPPLDSSILVEVSDGAHFKYGQVMLVDFEKCTLAGKCPSQPGWGQIGQSTISRAETSATSGSASSVVLGQKGTFGTGGSYKVSSVNAQFNLGTCAWGIPAGTLFIKESAASAQLSTPSKLKWGCREIPGQTDEVRDGNNAIRQMRVPEGLVDVITINALKYELRFYPASQITGQAAGLYTVSGSPMRTTVVENPDTTGATFTKLRFTESSGEVYDYEWKTSGWELSSGNGDGKVYREDVWNTSNSNCVTRIDTKDVAGNIIGCVQQTIHTNQYGRFVLSETVGTGGAATTDTYSYNWSTNGYNRWVYQADGAWAYEEYDSLKRLTNRIVSFQNQAPTTTASLARQFQYDYSSNSIPGAGMSDLEENRKPRRTIEKLLGQEVGRSYWIKLPGSEKVIRCASVGAAWNATDNLVTTTLYNQEYGPFYGLVTSVEMPNGVMEFREYYTNTTATVTNIISRGKPNAGKTAIVDGIKTIESIGACGEMLKRETLDIASGIQTSSELFSNYDTQRRPRKVTFLDNSSEWTEYGCCGPTFVTNRYGVKSTFYRDSLGRITSSETLGIIQTNILDSAGRTLKQMRKGTNGTTIIQFQNGYDNVGRLLAQTNAVNGVSTFAEAVTGNQKTTTETMADGGTRVSLYYRDGSLAKVTGTAVNPVRYEYGVESDGGVYRSFTKEVKLDASGNDTSEWTKRYADLLGRQYKILFADSATSVEYFNVKGQRIRSVDPDGVTMLYQYNDLGEVEYTALDADRDGVIDFDQTDRITRKVANVSTAYGYNVLRTTTYLWATNSSTYSNVVSVAETSTDGLRSWSTSLGLIRSSVKSALVGTTYNVTTTEPDGTSSVETTQSGRVISRTGYDSSSAQLGKENISYDAHGRPYAITDARNGTTYTSYTDDDKVTAVTSPVPGSGKAAQLTSTFYDPMGRVQRVVHPDGNIVTNLYFETGLLKKTYGVRSYPVEYTYDAQGRMKTMKTWQNFNANSGTATTTWSYDGYRGFMTNKTYADGKGTGYTYTSGGRLKTRTWARNLTTTYETNALGDTALVLYSDGTTPNITNTFDRLGRKTETIYGGAKRQWTYDLVGKTLTETNIGGSLSTWNVVRSYDSYQRPSSFNLKLAGTSQLQQDTTYDSGSRIGTLTHGSQNLTYSYHANSGLIKQMTFKENTTTRMVSTRQYDFLNRLTKMSSGLTATSQPWTAFEYDLNSASQRTRSTMADGSYWIYEYDSLGQVKSGKRYWSDGTLVAGQQFEYAFDDIGNRTSTKQGGDANGANPRSATYTPNTLNQYSQRTVPGGFDVIGAANAAATITVNGNAPYRYGEYFRWEMPVSNGSAPVWQSVANIASLSGTNMTNAGNVYIPRTAEAYAYDFDGNLTSDGRWNYTWDGENRLIGMEAIGTVPSGAKLKLSFEYDHQGRRIRKKVFAWTGTAYSSTASLDIKFLYDGWNLVVEANGSDALQRQYHWGIDLSGSMQGAGGVGGLLRMYDQGTSTHYYTTYDGNGNIASLVRQDTGVVAASYEYGPFGEIVKMSGTVAKTNPFRFSTKYQDDDTDLIYYGYRYYGCATGRWLNRDPLAEKGGLNISAFVNGDPINYIDMLGLACTEQTLKFRKSRPMGGFSLDLSLAVKISKCDDCCTYVELDGMAAIDGGWRYIDEGEVNAAGFTFGYSFEGHLTAGRAERAGKLKLAFCPNSFAANGRSDIIMFDFGLSGGGGAKLFAKSLGIFDVSGSGSLTLNLEAKLGLGAQVSVAGRCADISVLGNAFARVKGDAYVKGGGYIKAGAWKYQVLEVQFGYKDKVLEQGGFIDALLWNGKLCF